MSHPGSVLALSGIVKRFGVVTALDGAALHVRPESVHALLGENGAGKTTLMRIAFGLIAPDAGTMHVAGLSGTLKSPADAMALGIGMVHQHFTLVPAMTVAENVSLGMRGRFDARIAAERVRAIGERTGLHLDPDARVSELPVGAQQRLEIVKALARDIRILILDEPTAVLAPGEAEELLAWIRRWATDGNAAILITHKLREARAVADHITILRRGRTALTGAADTLDEPAIVRAMLGPDVALHEPTSASTLGTSGSPAYGAAPRLRQTGDAIMYLRDVSVKRDRGDDALHEASLDVRAGEIVGVAAIEGAGQHELLRVLAGRLTPTRGQIRLPSRIGFIPEDRHRDAIVPEMTLTENVALHGLGARTGTMPWAVLRTTTAATIERFDVRASGPTTQAQELSGGNQQKLVFGRELQGRPEGLVAENPTRGLDIRATTAVHTQLRAARDQGCAVVVYSSDLDEVLALADRVLVVHAGTVREVSGSRDDIGRAMLGAA